MKKCQLILICLPRPTSPADAAGTTSPNRRAPENTALLADTAKVSAEVTPPFLFEEEGSKENEVAVAASDRQSSIIILLNFVSIRRIVLVVGLSIRRI